MRSKMRFGGIPPFEHNRRVAAQKELKRLLKRLGPVWRPLIDAMNEMGKAVVVTTESIVAFAESLKPYMKEEETDAADPDRPAES